LQFVEWEAVPYEFVEDKDNYPGSMEDFAKSVGVARKTLYDWRRKQGHWERVTERYNSLHKRKSLKVRDALFEKTQGVMIEKEKKDKTCTYKLPPDPKAIELWLKYEDKWIERYETKLSGEVNVKAEQCAGIYRKAMGELKKLKGDAIVKGGKRGSK